MKTIKAISFYLAGLISGGGVFAGLTASADVGDAIIKVSGGSHCLTAQQALCLANCAIDAGLWDGANTDLTGLSASRTADCESGFTAAAVGLKSMALEEVPLGSVVHGVVTE